MKKQIFTPLFLSLILGLISISDVWADRFADCHRLQYDSPDEYQMCLRVSMSSHEGYDCYECMQEESNPWLEALGMVVGPAALLGSVALSSRYAYKGVKAQSDAAVNISNNCRGTISDYSQALYDRGANPMSELAFQDAHSTCNGLPHGVYSGMGGIYGGGAYPGYGNSWLGAGYTPGFMGAMIGPYGGGFQGGGIHAGINPGLGLGLGLLGAGLAGGGIGINANFNAGVGAGMYRPGGMYGPGMGIHGMYGPGTGIQGAFRPGVGMYGPGAGINANLNAGFQFGPGAGAYATPGFNGSIYPHGGGLYTGGHMYPGAQANGYLGIGTQGLVGPWGGSSYWGNTGGFNGGAYAQGYMQQQQAYMQQQQQMYQQQMRHQSMGQAIFDRSAGQAQISVPAMQQSLYNDAAMANQNLYNGMAAGSIVNSGVGGYYGQAPYAAGNLGVNFGFQAHAGLGYSF